MTDTATNLPEISVSDLSGAIKRTIEGAFGYVRVRGEISGYRGPSASGHVYFALKDHNAKIEAVIWKGVFGRLRAKPEEGLEVIATGKVSTFPGSSKYQLVIESLEPAGVGALLAQLEERRKRLAAEGLFDPARKQLLPYMPRVLGVVTSPTGAVIRDIIHRISDRFPLHILVWPVRVQGEQSAAEVAAAIRGFNALAEDGAIPRPDVLIVARGGGSLEDLWGFNDEIVVRAAAESGIPLVSAVGHETDTTLIDHAADLRAPTPTGAAELIVPVRAELLMAIGSFGQRIEGGLRRLVERWRAELRAVARALPLPEALLAQPRQRLDRAGDKLAPALRRAVDGRRLLLASASQKLERHSPRTQLALRRERLARLSADLKRALEGRIAKERDDTARRQKDLAVLAERFTRAFGRRVDLETVDIARRRERGTELGARLRIAARRNLVARRDAAGNVAKLFDSLNYRSVLQRGYAIVRDGEGRIVRSVAAAPAGVALSITLADGNVGVTVGGAPRARTPKAGSPQDDLFG
ncbi:MAG: exodeoxyribonuclease VII large subunit [Beijerinckiaceae bacterium]